MKKKRVPNSVNSGSVLIELILSIPLLIGVPLAVLEFARFLRFTQLANVYSQEAALSSYRACSDYYVIVQNPTSGNASFDPDLTRQQTQDCLQRLRTRLQARLDALLPAPQSAQLVLSVYRDGFLSNSPGLALVAIEPAQNANNASQTKYRSNGAHVLQRTGSSGIEDIVPDARVQQRERLVVSEVIFRYTPLMTLIPLLNIDTTALGVEYRETTIL